MQQVPCHALRRQHATARSVCRIQELRCGGAILATISAGGACWRGSCLIQASIHCGEKPTMKYALLFLSGLLAAPSIALSQPYASVQLGYASADFPLGPPYNGVVDDNAAMLGVEAGMAFGKWGGEIGFNEYGSFDGFGTPCADGAVCPPITQQISGNDQTLWKLAVMRRFEIGNVRLFGKAGYYSAHLKSNVSLPDADFSPDGVMLGAGIRWYFSAPWS